MRKIVFLLVSITSILANLYIFTEKSNDLAMDFLIGGQRQLVQLDMERGEEAETLESIIPFLNDFSEKHEISIAQYHLFMSHDVNIYMTNIANNPYIHLSQGEYPYGNFHLSNRRFYPENVRQSGRLAFPFSSLDLRIYDFEQIRNLGLLGVFHLIGADEEVTDLFLEELSTFGEASLAYGDYIMNSVEYGALYITNIEATPLRTTIFFSFFVLFIGICFFLLKYRRQLLLERLWGYSHLYSYYSIPKLFLPFYIGLTIFSGILLTGILLLGNQGNLVSRCAKENDVFS